jgi:hypothetical protein
VLPALLLPLLLLLVVVVAAACLPHPQKLVRAHLEREMTDAIQGMPDKAYKALQKAANK